jgi:hypothetical protein
MKMEHKKLVLVLLLPLVTVGTGVGSAQPALSAAPTAGSQQPDYHPTMADLMTMMVQPRHIKLGLAGQAKNWTYAAYEASELRNAFTRTAKTVPVFNNTDVAAMIASTIQQPMADAISAANSHDAKAFDTAYSQITASCNSCHQSYNKEVIVIKVPDAGMFPDQNFHAVEKASDK